MVFSKVEVEENEKGVEEENCEEIDIVNNNNGFYKTYVQYMKTEDYGQQRMDQQKKKKGGNKKKDDVGGDNNNNNNSDEDSELGVLDNKEDDDDMVYDEEVFDIHIGKMNGDNNDIGSLCVLINIFNDNNTQNKGKTNNITNCYIRLLDTNNDRKELCRYTVNNINDDKKTVALVLGYINKLENGCWALNTNNVPLKGNSKLEYQDYAKQIVLGKYSQKNVANKNSCCVIL